MKRFLVDMTLQLRVGIEIQSEATIEEALALIAEDKSTALKVFSNSTAQCMKNNCDLSHMGVGFANVLEVEEKPSEQQLELPLHMAGSKELH